MVPRRGATRSQRTRATVRGYTSPMPPTPIRAAISNFAFGCPPKLAVLELAEVLRNAVALFPGEVVPLEPDAVDRVVESWDDAVLARLAALDRRVWNARDVDEHLIDYLRHNQRDVLCPERGIAD